MSCSLTQLLMSYRNSRVLFILLIKFVLFTKFTCSENDIFRCFKIALHGNFIDLDLDLDIDLDKSDKV